MRPAMNMNSSIEPTSFVKERERSRSRFGTRSLLAILFKTMLDCDLLVSINERIEVFKNLSFDKQRSEEVQKVVKM